MDTPLSRSNVSLKLTEIQKRCEKLMEMKEEQLELSLEDQDHKASAARNSFDPYNHSKQSPWGE